VSKRFVLMSTVADTARPEAVALVQRGGKRPDRPRSIRDDVMPD
jgi:hypothetical protein